jgi:hypothetical protein
VRTYIGAFTSFLTSLVHVLLCVPSCVCVPLCVRRCEDHSDRRRLDHTATKVKTVATTRSFLLFSLLLFLFNFLQFFLFDHIFLLCLSPFPLPFLFLSRSPSNLRLQEDVHFFPSSLSFFLTFLYSFIHLFTCHFLHSFVH